MPLGHEHDDDAIAEGYVHPAPLGLADTEHPPRDCPGTLIMSKDSQHSAALYLPQRRSLTSLREAALHCKGCELYRNATQTVFGAGLKRSAVVLVGEQPGDEEDRRGRPFVGPAGRLLDEAIRAAGLDPKTVYITNAVKHFKWEARGKRRLHKKPSEREIVACSPWLAAELAVVSPAAVMCLGATAVRAMFGAPLRVKDYRGRFHRSSLHPNTFVTVHPSSILRLRSADSEGYSREYDRFVEDLESVGGAFGAE